MSQSLGQLRLLPKRQGDRTPRHGSCSAHCTRQWLFIFQQGAGRATRDASRCGSRV
jgi:hypothetical protein